MNSGVSFVFFGGGGQGGGSGWHSLGNSRSVCARRYLCSGVLLLALRWECLNTEYTAEWVALSVKRCEGDLFTLGRHITLMGLERSGSRSALWLLQDLVGIHKQTVVRPPQPRHPAPTPTALLRCVAATLFRRAIQWCLASWEAYQVTANRP